jgi:hypothetical protein
MDNITIEMKMNALHNVLKKNNVPNDKMDLIKKEFFNELIK